MKVKTKLPYLSNARCFYCGNQWIIFSPCGFNESWALKCTNCGTYGGAAVD